MYIHTHIYIYMHCIYIYTLYIIIYIFTYIYIYALYIYIYALFIYIYIYTYIYIYIYICIYAHTHTHTHMYIFIYIFAWYVGICVDFGFHCAWLVGRGLALSTTAFWASCSRWPTTMPSQSFPGVKALGLSRERFICSDRMAPTQTTVAQYMIIEHIVYIVLYFFGS